MKRIIQIFAISMLTGCGHRGAADDIVSSLKHKDIVVLCNSETNGANIRLRIVETWKGSGLISKISTNGYLNKELRATPDAVYGDIILCGFNSKNTSFQCFSFYTNRVNDNVGFGIGAYQEIEKALKPNNQ